MDEPAHKRPADDTRIPPEARAGTGRFTRHGLSWFVEQGVGLFLPKRPEDFLTKLNEAEQLTRDHLAVAGVDFVRLREDEVEAMIDRLEASPERVDWWALLTNSFARSARAALEGRDPREAALRMARFQWAWSMFFFAQNVEHVAWRGYEAVRENALERALKVWADHAGNDSEEFWQETLGEHAVVLSQVLAAPAMILEAKAYVGGKTVSNVDGQVVDFLLANALTGSVALVEIKTPATRLLGSRYRAGVYPLSKDLAGGVSQVLSQRHTLLVKSRDVV